MAQLLEACYESAQMESRLREQDTPLNELERAIAQQQPDQFRSFIQSLVSPEVAVIAEHKRKSPGGKIYPEREIGEVVRQYQTGGALALSVLTEGEHFGGKLGDLHEARQATRLPVMRKDFIGTPLSIIRS